VYGGRLGSHGFDPSSHHKHGTEGRGRWEIQRLTVGYYVEDGGSQGWKCQGGVLCVTYTEHKIHPRICDSANKLQLGRGRRGIESMCLHVCAQRGKKARYKRSCRRWRLMNPARQMNMVNIVQWGLGER
jgi:hypothetical protein